MYVYEKHGLCRGDPIGNANFAAIVGGRLGGLETMPLAATQGGPLGGETYRYKVERPYVWMEWNMRVDAPAYQPWDFYVHDGETHDVWLSHD